ncbi:MAG: hypothetical protein V4525_06030 [Pseudomonadota bacterium]
MALKPALVDDGWLVYDRNENGTIDTGAELFGVDTVLENGKTAADGFAALRELDKNQDGLVNQEDADFNKLRVWRDANQDGISQSNELTTLAERDIVSIGVGATATNIDLGNGNVQSAVGVFTKTGGSTGTTDSANAANTAANLELLMDSFHSQFINAVPLTDQSKSLPGVCG